MWPAILLLALLLIPVLAIVLDSRVGHALASRLERPALSPGDEEAGERIARLEGEIERLGGEIERLDEESQFLHDLLLDRASEERGLGSASDSPRLRRPSDPAASLPPEDERSGDTPDH